MKREAVNLLDKMLVQTDCGFTFPVPERNDHNISMNTNEKQALQQFAEVPQLSMESIDSLKPEEIEKDLKSSKRKAKA